jgi:peptidyl-prolyl cis-trans isomerase SurA
MSSFTVLTLCAALVAQSGTPPRKLDPDTVAIVNGHKLAREDFHKFLETQLGSAYLTQFISNYLVETEAQKLGVTLAPGDVEKKLDSYMVNVAARYGGDQKKFLEEIQRSGTDPEAWKESLRMRFRNEALLEQIVRKNRKVSDDELKAAFERTYGEGGTKLVVRHILLSTNLLAPKYKDRFSEEEFYKSLEKVQAEAKERAQAFLNRVNGGEDFAKVALESDDFTAQKGGDLGEAWQNRYGEEFDKAAGALKVGETTGPVKSNIGWHVIQAQPADFDEKYQVRQILILSDVGSPGRAEAKKRAEAVLERVKKGEDFAQLAREFSDDRDSKEKGGELPPFGKGEKVAQLENAVAALMKDQLAPLVETDFGFHVVQLRDKVRTPKGDKKRIAHILVSTQYWKVRENKLKPMVEEEARKRAESVLQELKAGKDFNELCQKESDEVFTKANGGLLENYTRHRVSPEFHEAIVKLKSGEFSGLVKTPHGYHIAKVDQVVQTKFEDVRQALTQQESEKPATPLEMQNLRQELERKATIEK